MDSNVVSSFRKAELAKKMGFNHNKIMRSPVCEDKVMHLVDNKGLRVPVDERDNIMDSAYRKELQTALDKSSEPGFVCENCGDARDEKLYKAEFFRLKVETILVRNFGIADKHKCGECEFVVLCVCECGGNVVSASAAATADPDFLQVSASSSGSSIN
ncbi:hypothetical protein IFM89_039112 [Coptis chinensis]|uniref:Uncharacterized protein n=1 Tax=Coptis chinensis TaxID=261450 RepID=A0A835ILM2_9MAGN|nr:hypothetical protein IFM89_039112 [Coptis chinensis]